MWLINSAEIDDWRGCRCGVRETVLLLMLSRVVLAGWLQSTARPVIVS